MEIKHTSKLLDYADFIGHSDTYLESGTCYGQSICRAIDAGFKRIKSVELDAGFYEHCLTMFKDQPNVVLYHGHSTDKWPEMLKDVVKSVIFLDAHPAGPGTAGHNEFEEGDGRYGQDAIITRELEIILGHRNDHLIVIDDQNGENTDNAKYMDMCLAVNPNYTFEFWDENLSNDPEYYYKDKILVCLP